MAVDLRQNHFRFGLNSGNEATHGWLGNEDAAISMVPGVTFLLRIVTQEVGGTALANCDYTWQYNKNGAGWNNITTTSNVVKSVTPKTWANNADCTQRLTGSGGFEASAAGCTTDGTSGGTSNDIAASGCSETEIALQIVVGDVANGDTIQFQVTSPDTTITNNVTPSLTVDKSIKTGVLSAAGAFLAKITGKSLKGTLATSGWISIIRVLKVLANQTSCALSFAGSIVGVRAGQQFFSYTSSGVQSLVGTLIRLINNLTRTYSGAISSVGAISRLINNLTRLYYGTISPSGLLNRLFSITQKYTGETTPSGTVPRTFSITRIYSGVLSFVGVVVGSFPKSRTYASVAGFAGSVLRLFNISSIKSGAVSFSKTLTYIVLVNYYSWTGYGAASFSGIVNRLLSFYRTKSGTLTSSGTYQRMAGRLKTCSGTLASIGTLIAHPWRMVGNLNFSGVVTNTKGRVRKLTFTGWLSIIRVVKYLPNHIQSLLTFTGTVVGYVGSSLPYAGFISAAGSITRRITNLTRSLSGALSSAGTAIGQKWGYAVYNETKDGILDFAGTIIDVLVITPYTYVKNRAMSFVGTVTHGSLQRVKTISGVVSFTKELGWSFGSYVHVHYYRTYAGVLSAVGTLRKAFDRTKSGVLASAGTARKSFVVTRTKDGSVDLSGTIYGWLSGTVHFLYGYPASVLSFAGEVYTGFIITYFCSGVASFRGAISRFLSFSRAESSTVSFRGRAYGDKITDALYYGSPYGGSSY